MSRNKYGILALTLIGAFVVAIAHGFLHQTSVVYAEYNERGMNDIVVTDMPYADRSRIKWYLENRNEFRTEFDIPQIDPYKNYTIVFWDASDGFTNWKLSPHEDLFCFDKMKREKNCLIKNVLMVARKSPGQDETVTIGYSGDEYRITAKGELIAVPDTE